MSLFVDRSPGADTGSVTTDLFSISWNDGNLGQGADTTVSGGLGGITTIPVAPVTYSPNVTTGMATADRLFTLVNNDASDGLNWGNPIVITPLPGGIDPYSGLDVTGNGFAYVDTNVTPNVIHAVYDTSNNNGNGLVVYDVDGHAIQIPNAVLLYHELSHAFHSAIDQNPFPQTECPDIDTDEPAAEIDENVMRTQLGLCLRDVCNHGGDTGWGRACGGSATPGGPPLVDGNAPDQDTGCFVVTAATGSRHAQEILHLRELRDRLTARSNIAETLISAIYDEYFSFSPEIAAKIAVDPAARAAVLGIVVRPLLAWYELAEQLARAPEDHTAVDRHVMVVVAACEPKLAVVAVPLLHRIGKGATDPESIRVTHYFGRVAELPLTRWAILEPLTRVWTGSRSGAELVEAVAEWLSGAPLESLPPPESERELRVLGQLLAFAPEARRRLGGRLAQVWTAQRAALKRYGFVDDPKQKLEG